MPRAGPRTRNGKAIVAANAVRHGLRSTAILVPDESRDDWVAFRKAIIADYGPLSPVEAELAERGAERS